ncbi:AraC family transcriptional regulator [Flavobacterium sp. 140616W15]|uniref:helix-turn-helix domain-containing protein n=1 Tax=Flavobacterium sp. 140616W15 TaxID=2478552 RepID=UPI000F0D07EC|nr:helix-turn-helix domain-containing protein [Flavobacterium sp. 140616W15]AYN03531.1 AraC family transcriptional regulator [Flavobacterium sp. 140616W15]
MISIFSASIAIVILICILVSVLLIGYSLKTKSYNILLAIFFILLSYPFFILFLVDTGLIKYVPHVYRTSLIAHLLCMPASYLYVRSATKNKGLTKGDFIYIIPVLIYIVDYWPFFSLTGAEKIGIMHSLQLNKKVLFFYESRFFCAGFYIVFKYVLAFAYWIAQFNFIIGLYRVKNSDFKKENRICLMWFSIFVSSQIFLFFPLLNLLELSESYDKLIVFLFTGGPTALFAITLFLFPRILFGIKGIVLADENYALAKKSSNLIPLILDQNKEQSTTPKYLSHSKMKEIALQIKMHIDHNSSYLDAQCTLRQLSEELSIPMQYISAVINECEKVNFNDFINSYRIEYCLKLLKENDHKNQTLESIAAKSGFNNRNTFTVAFKKVMGQTPSYYIKKSASLVL